MEIEAKDTVPAEASAINPPQVEEGTGGNREREGSHDEMRWEIHEAKEDAGSVVEKTLALLVKSSEAAKAGRDYADIIDTMQQAVDCLCSIKGESSQQSLVQAVMRDEDIYLACCMLIDVCLHPSAGDHDVALRFLATIFQWQEESNGENDSAHLVVCSLLPSILLTYWAVLSEDRHAPLLSALEALLVGMYNLEVQGKGSAECCVLLSKLPSSKTAAQYDTMSDGRLSSPSAILSESALKSMLADDVGESEASFHQKTLCSSPVSRIDNSSVDSNPVLEFWLGRFGELNDKLPALARSLLVDLCVLATSSGFCTVLREMKKIRQELQQTEWGGRRGGEDDAIRSRPTRGDLWGGAGGDLCLDQINFNASSLLFAKGPQVSLHKDADQDKSYCRPGKRILLASRVSLAMLALLRNFRLQHFVLEFVLEASAGDLKRGGSQPTSAKGQEAQGRISQLGEFSEFAMHVIACRAALEMDEKVMLGCEATRGYLSSLPDVLRECRQVSERNPLPDPLKFYFFKR